MAADEVELSRLIVRLTGDGSSYQRMLADATKGAQLAATAVQAAARKIEGFQSSITGFAKTALGALSGLGVAGTLSAAFAQFSDADKTMRHLAIAIETNGAAVESTLADYKQFAGEISKTTLLTRGATLSMLEQAQAVGLTGEAAKGAVQYAIALSGINKTSAAENMHLAIAIAQGNTHMLRRALHLHHIKDEAQVLAEAQKRLEAGWKMAQDDAGSAAGQLEKLKTSLSELGVEVGALVAEYLSPLVKWVQRAVDAFKAMSPEARRATVQVLAVAAAIPAIGPALIVFKATVGAAFGPLVSMLGLAFSGFMALLSPVGLVVGALAGAAAAAIYFSGTGGQALDWLGQRWGELKDDALVGIGGIADALKAANLPLAFEIAWTQIKLTLLRATQGLRETWIDFLYHLKSAWADFSSWFVSRWEETKYRFKELGIDIQRERYQNELDRAFKAGEISEERRADLQAKIDAKFGKAYADNAAELNKAMKDIEEARAKAIADAGGAYAKSIEGVKGELDALKGLRDELVRGAGLDAKIAERVKVKKFELPPFPRIAPQTVEVKLVAAAFNSAEAVTRMQAQMDKLKGDLGLATGMGGAPGAPAGLPIAPVPAGAPAVVGGGAPPAAGDDDGRKRIVELLVQIELNTRGGGVIFGGAGIEA